MSLAFTSGRRSLASRTTGRVTLLCCVFVAEVRLLSAGSAFGRTSTAVTLYSGQFVAQSELSVVTTFAPDSGWWKRRVDDARLHAIRDGRAEGRDALAAL